MNNILYLFSAILSIFTFAFFKGKKSERDEQKAKEYKDLWEINKIKNENQNISDNKLDGVYDKLLSDKDNK